MTNEQTFVQWLRGLFTERDEDWTRIESMTENGIPDINICKCGIDVWVEAKVRYPKGVLLRKEQYAWAVRRSECGGSIYCLAWDIANDTVLCYHLNVGISARPSGDGKTLIIMSPPDTVLVRLDRDTKRAVKSFLFPMGT